MRGKAKVVAKVFKKTAKAKEMRPESAEDYLENALDWI